MIYAQCLGFGLVWDDPVVLDAQLPRIDSLTRAFVPPPDLPGRSGSYYRPLVWLSYRADDAIAGRPADPVRRRRTQALVFHATSVVLHAAASALVFLFGAQLLRRTWRDELALVAAVAGGLLFAVHPVHVDSVAAIAGRSDSLCAVFGLLALLCFVRHDVTP